MKKAPRKVPRAAEPAAAHGEASVRIADLKARLSAHLRLVRAGGSLTILDRNTPVARLVPLSAAQDDLIVRPALQKWSNKMLPPPLDPPIDATALLRELRRDRF